MINPNDTVSASSYYTMLNEMVVRSNDPFFAAYIGTKIARRGLLTVFDGRELSRSVGDYLTQLRILFHRSNSHARYEFQDDGERAVFRLLRSRETVVPTANIDALNACGIATLLNDALKGLPARGIVAHVSDPSLVPPKIIAPSAVMRSNKAPMSVSFPSEWLLLELKKVTEKGITQTEGIVERVRTDLSLEVITGVISERLSDTNMNAESTARLLGLSVRQLQRYLNSHETNFRTLVYETRAAQARQLLRDRQDLSVRDVALACGYSTSQSLARAFRTCFGQTPSEIAQNSSKD